MVNVAVPFNEHRCAWVGLEHLFDGGPEVVVYWGPFPNALVDAFSFPYFEVCLLDYH